MQKTILAATLAAVLGMGGTAYAADLNGGSLKDAPYVPETSWTGFYLGAGGGGAMTNDDLKLSDTYKNKSRKNSSAEVKGLGGEGGFGSVQVGYDRQFGGFVAGVFFDYDFDSVNGDISITDNGKTHKASWLERLLVRRRLGWVTWLILRRSPTPSRPTRKPTIAFPRA